MKTTDFLSRLQVLLLGALLTLFCPLAEGKDAPKAEGVTDYGDLFLVEQEERSPDKALLQVHTGIILSNPYFTSQFLDFTASVGLGRFLKIGAEVTHYWNQRTEVNAKIDAELKSFSFKQILAVRERSVYVRLTSTPFSGNMSFFGVNRLPISLNLSLAPGGSWYDPGSFETELCWKLGFSVQASRHLGISAAFGQIVGLSSQANNDSLGSIGMDVFL